MSLKAFLFSTALILVFLLFNHNKILYCYWAVFYLTALVLLTNGFRIVCSTGLFFTLISDLVKDLRMNVWGTLAFVLASLLVYCLKGKKATTVKCRNTDRNSTSFY